MKLSIFILFLILLTATLFAQAPDTMWTKTFGDSLDDEGHSVQQTNDGGYIITGGTDMYFTKRLSGGDTWLIKTDANGDTMWTKTFEGSRSDWGNSVRQTIDGGYIIVGITGANFTAFGHDGNVIMMKTDSNGDSLWTKTSRDSLEISWANSVQQTTGGGYIVCGSKNFMVWLIKTDINGDTLWAKTFGKGDGQSVQQTTDGGYIITGYKEIVDPVYHSDVWLIKTDSNGDTLWTKTFGGSGYDTGNSVQQTTDGGYIITGYKEIVDPVYHSDVWLIKTDSNGDTLWTKIFGGSGYDTGNSVQQTTDGGYIITGWTDSFGAGYGDVLLIKTDAAGDSLWTKTIGGIFWDQGHSVRQTSDGGYVITGGTDSFGAGGRDVWLIKIAPDVTAIDENPNTLIKAHHLQQNHPNPFNPSTQIQYSIPQSMYVEIKIFDVLGNEIETLVNEEKPAGTYEITWYAENLTSGVYFYQLRAGNFTQTKKMILLK